MEGCFLEYSKAIGSEDPRWKGAFNNTVILYAMGSEEPRWKGAGKSSASDCLRLPRTSWEGFSDI